MDSSKGMTVEQFLREGHLQHGDIVLFRGKGGILSRLIRWATKSHFSHAALVFVIPKREEGFENAYVIESGGGGVDLTDLRHYLESDDYDVAVRRFERPWFAERSPALPKKIRGNMLDFIKGDYDTLMTWRLGLSLAYCLLLRKDADAFERVLHKLLDKGKILPSTFICSGFVQHGYYRTIKRQVDAGALPEECLADVVFHPGEGSSTPRRLATTPRELAASDKLTWKFASRREGGVTKIHPIASERELEELLGSR